jgi:hypothetical protein
MVVPKDGNSKEKTTGTTAAASGAAVDWASQTAGPGANS